MATQQQTRRQVLRGGLALAGLGLMGVPEWVLPALAQGEQVVPFTDLPETFPPATAERRFYDVRTIDGPLTPRDQFFTIQHYGHPEIDPAAFRLRVSGLVERPQALSVADLRALGPVDVVAGFECSGNRRPLQALCGNGRWTGVPLRAVLERAGLQSTAREVVFFGADKGEEQVEFRQQSFTVDQQFARSLPRDIALSDRPLVVYAMNGDPLTRHQGAPVRLLVPGYYGVANVKWLSEVHVQEDQFLGKWQARWYRTLSGETINGDLKWVERAISRMRLKSFVARVTRTGDRHTVLGVVLNDGTPIRGVEVRVDEGPWQAATLDTATSDRYGWKLFRHTWTGATPGEHTLVSRVTDTSGAVQPTEEDLANKRTFLEDNSQHPRRVRIG
jgi:DMSO/TMAO reductase YedYZ molybdopterin-dependent catalytic subunit